MLLLKGFWIEYHHRILTSHNCIMLNNIHSWDFDILHNGLYYEIHLNGFNHFPLNVFFIQYYHGIFKFPLLYY